MQVADQSRDELKKKYSRFKGASPRPTANPLHQASAVAELAAYHICRQPLDLTGRKIIAGYAIDGADPETPMDRDDAISVEFHHDAVRGNLATLHVTIADVASVIPNDTGQQTDHRITVLDEEAGKRGETQYFSHGIDPMLPHRLQDRLSLEQGKERAGLTISVTMDDQCNIVHTEFSRTRITSQCRSYRNATRDIQIHGHPIQQIAMVATRLLGRKSGVTNLPRYDEATGTYTDSEGVERHVSPDELSAYATVQGSMIAANEAAAGIMRGSNFLFRNHSHLYVPREGGKQRVFYRKKDMRDLEEQAGKLMQNRAEYSETCKGHYGLDSEAYSHVTSPIRRYADLVNQRMMHWAIDVVDAVTDGIMKDAKLPATMHEKLHHCVWDHAAALLEKATAMKQADRRRTRRASRQFEDEVVAILKEGPVVTARPRKVAEHIAKAVQEIPLPYTHKQLAALARTLNDTLEQNRAKRREMRIDKRELQLNLVFPNTDARQLAEAWGATSFADLLEAAAQRGDNNEVFSAEVIKRLDEDRTTLVQNLHSILVVAGQRRGDHWQRLKRHALLKLKADPALAEEVFAHMLKQQHNNPDTQTHIAEVVLLDNQNNTYPSAQVVHSHQKVDYAAPLIAADTPEHARQVALLVFFRNYGSLHRRDQIDTPELIELAIARAKVRKGDRLELLRRTCGGSFTINENITSARDMAPVPDDKRVEVELEVRHRITGESIVKKAIGHQESARDKAAKYILDDPRFRDMLTQEHAPMEPDESLSDKHADILPEALWTRNIRTFEQQNRRPGP